MDKKELIINGKVVKYIEAGGEKDVPVLLLHGVPESSLIWKNVLPTIASLGFRAIAPDLPGFGQSEPFHEPSTWQRYNDFISEFTNALNLEKFHLIVHDWGGLIGLGWTTLHLDKVLSIVISNSTISEEYRWHKLAQIWRTPGIGEEAFEKMSDWKAFYTGMKPSMPIANEDDLYDFFRVFQQAASSSVILQLYRSGNINEVKFYFDKLPMITVPVTILWGEKDPFVPVEFAHKLKSDSIPHAKVIVIPDASHFIHLEVPEQVNNYVKQHFLSFDNK